MRAGDVLMMLALVAGCGRLEFTPASQADGGDDGPATDGASSDGLASCVMGADPHDEDADGVIDACDVCPGIADAAQLDRDGDTIGDVCDPRPDASGDVRVLFDPFAGATLAPTWVVQGGTWTLANDALTQSEAAVDRRVYDTQLGVTQDLVVETRVTFLDLSQPGDRNAGVVLRLEPTAGNGYVTGVFLDSTNTLGALKIWRMTSGTAGNPTETPLPPPQLGVSYTIVAGASGGRLLASAAGQSVLATDSNPATGAFALRTQRVAARYDYVIAYRAGGPL